jgi:hypothetical protein
MLAFEYDVRKRFQAEKALKNQKIKEAEAMALKKMEESLKIAI